MLLIILTVFLFLILLYYLITKQEPFIEKMDRNIGNQGSKPYSTTKRFYGGTFNSTFNGRAAIDDQYFDDKLFNDVTYYPNEYDDNGKLIQTGWINCKQECSGHCLEYGLYGASYCFSY